MKTYDEWATAIFENSGKTEEAFENASGLALQGEWEKFRNKTEARVQAYWENPCADLFFRKHSRGLDSVVELLFKCYPFRGRSEVEMSFSFRANGGSKSDAYYWTYFSPEVHKLIKSFEQEFEDFAQHVIALKHIRENRFWGIF